MNEWYAQSIVLDLMRSIASCFYVCHNCSKVEKHDIYEMLPSVACLHYNGWAYVLELVNRFCKSYSILIHISLYSLISTIDRCYVKLKQKSFIQWLLFN